MSSAHFIQTRLEALDDNVHIKKPWYKQHLLQSLHFTHKISFNSNSTPSPKDSFLGFKGFTEIASSLLSRKNEELKLKNKANFLKFLFNKHSLFLQNFSLLNGNYKMYNLKYALKILRAQIDNAKSNCTYSKFF